MAVALTSLRSLLSTTDSTSVGTTFAHVAASGAGGKSAGGQRAKKITYCADP